MAEWSVDFSDYEERAQGARVPQGFYLVKITDGEKKESSNGNPYVALWLEIPEGPFAGQGVRDNIMFMKEWRWKISQILTAAGMKKPEGQLTADKFIKALKGRVIGVELADGEPYKDRIKSEVQNYVTAEMAKEIIDRKGDEGGGLSVFKGGDDDDDEGGATQESMDDLDEFDADAIA